MTRGSDGWRGLNVGLVVVLVLCLGAVGYCGTLMWQQHRDDDGDTSGNVFRKATSLVLDRRADPDVARAGDKLGDRTVTAVPDAPRSEQERITASLKAATKMVTAFLNVRYDDLDANIAAVRSMATGPFRKQYDKSVKGIRTAATSSKSVSTSKVVWSAYVTGDEDSASVLLAASGTVQNKTATSPQARTYRVLVELAMTKSRWLTRDLQFVG